MNVKYYSGIGSRETSPEGMRILTEVAHVMSVKGYTLRSGGADGADKAFEAGAMRKEIFLPWKNFNKNPAPMVEADWEGAKKLTYLHHPAPTKLTAAALLLMQRNAFQVLGADLKTPVEIVLCWAAGPKFDLWENICDVSGGTGQAVRIAYAHKIPILNLWIPAHLEEWRKQYA